MRKAPGRDQALLVVADLGSLSFEKNYRLQHFMRPQLIPIKDDPDPIGVGRNGAIVFDNQWSGGILHMSFMSHF